MGSERHSTMMRKQGITDRPGPRDSAMAFMEGSQAGWLATDLNDWMKNHLLSQGRFCAQRGLIRIVREQGVGMVSLVEACHERRSRTQTPSLVPPLIEAARVRILQCLRQTIRSGETSFVNAALYAGRVSRERGADGKSYWFVHLCEDDTLSDQVLALFAADALVHPVDYEKSICVCDACGMVSFNPVASWRQGCSVHPQGSFQSLVSGELPHSHVTRS